MISYRLLNGCHIIVEATQEKYSCHLVWGKACQWWEFQHIEHHKSGALNNCAKDKTKTPEEVDELLKHGVIRMISVPSWYYEIWNK